MDTLDSMKSVLAPMGIYDIQNDSIIYAELSAYAEGLNLVNDELCTLERECFISTAQTYGLLLRERLIGILKDTLPIENRREMLLYHGGVSEDDFTKESIEDALISCGVIAKVLEYPAQRKIQINCIEILDTILTQEQIKHEASKYLPPQFEIVFDFSNCQDNTV